MLYGRVSAPAAFGLALGSPSQLLSSESELEPEPDESLPLLLLLLSDLELREKDNGIVKHCGDDQALL